MIQFTTRLLLKNKVLWAWPILIVAFVIIIGIWGDVESAQNSYSFVVGIGDVQGPSGFMLDQLLGLITLIAVIGLPTHFAKNLEPEQAAVILSKPISRTDFYLSDFASMLLVSLFYTIITIAAFAVLLAISAGIFPIQLYLAMLLFIPLYLLSFYITMVLFLVITESYLGSVLLGYILIPLVSGFLLHSEQFLQMMGYSSDLLQGALDVLSYFIPSAAGVQQLMQTVLAGGFGTFNSELFVFVLISFVAFFLLGLYMMRRKEF